MPMTMAEGEESFMVLDRRERAVILQRGTRNLEIRSEDSPQAEVEAAWRDELSKRIDDIRSGVVEFLDFDDSHRKIRAQLIVRRMEFDRAP